jgi:Asp-tRNA(Asn)/Glu-tRNA(Gln) amidotransferase A subunit family amidase
LLGSETRSERGKEIAVTDLRTLTAREAALQIAERRITAESLVTACLDPIEAREPVVGAWQHLDRERALATARQRDAEPPRGPLHGIPIAIKDLIDTVDMPTAYGSPIYRGHLPDADASCVALARAAGAVVLGKTVTTEFATFTPGKTANPHNPAHTPGGSSSGSAAAVADGMVPLAFGTQTAGSVIRPGAFCGCVAYKPSFGLINRAGVKPPTASTRSASSPGRSRTRGSSPVFCPSGRRCATSRSRSRRHVSASIAPRSGTKPSRRLWRLSTRRGRRSNEPALW